MAILKVDNVKKNFGKTRAVKGVSFEINEGEIFGLIGPNGAGKTTTIRMINNIYIPDEGNVFFQGEQVSSKAQEKIGYLPEERGLYKKLKVIEQIVYFAELKGIEKKEALKRAEYWLDRLDAKSWKNKKIQELSKGMQQKIQFITTLLHEPQLLVLDEPFSGFDPINQEQLKQIILEQKAAGKSIILSTHVMEQAESLCDTICLINKGEVVLSGGVREIKRSFGNDTITLEFVGDASFIDKVEGVKIVDKSANRMSFRISDISLKPNDLLQIAINNVEVIKFELSEPSMHEIFLQVAK